MIYYLSYLKDRVNNNYLGLNVPNDLIDPFLDELKSLIGEGDFEIFTKNQQLRDGGKFHLTVINVSDYNNLNSELGIDKFINSLEPVFHYEIDDLKMKGIGTSAKHDSRCFYVVCQSDKLTAIRERFSLEEHDFHITIGFNPKDVHGVRKNEVLKKEGKFLKLLASEYYKKNNWNFIREIGNFDLDKNADIIPIKLDELKLTVKVEGKYLEIIYLEDGEKFWVGTKSSITEELPRLSQTEIAKIFNKK